MQNQTPKLLGTYAQEKKHLEVRELEVSTNKYVARALEEFKYALENYLPSSSGGIGELEGYRKAQERLHGIKLSQNELQGFLVAIKEFEDAPHFERCGVFISALLSLMPVHDVTINLSHLDSRIHCIGMYNVKSLTINGNVGNGTGRSMIGGLITINGSAGFTDAALMSDGRIIVRDGHDVKDPLSGERTFCPPLGNTKDAIKRMKRTAPTKLPAKLPAMRKNKIR